MEKIKSLHVGKKQKFKAVRHLTVCEEFNLSKKKAEALREFVQSQKRNNPIIEAEFEETLVKPIPPQELLLRLSANDLFKIGVSQNHLRTAGIIMALFYGFLDDIEQALGFDFFKKMDKWIEEGGNGWALYLLAGIPIFIFISFLITLIRTMLRYYDFKFFKTDTGFKMVSGLFTINGIIIINVNLTR